jgi:hypothetical protein
MRDFDSLRSDIEPLSLRVQEILRHRAEHLSKAKDVGNSVVKKYFKFHCLAMLLIPFIIGALIIGGLFFGGIEGLIAGFFGGFGIFSFAFTALFAGIIFVAVRSYRADQEAQRNIQPADIKLEVMKPFLDLVLGQETGYLKQGSIASLIPAELVEQDIFTALRPQDALRDVVQARFGDTEAIFGEKRVARWVRSKGAVEELIGPIGMAVDLFDEGLGYEQVQVDALFMLLDFHKHFDGEMHLFSRSDDESLKEKWNLRKREKMGNPDFDRHFALYTTDATLARYILSPLLMERLVSLKVHYRCPLRVLFKNGEMLLELDWDRNMLETDVNDFVGKFTKERTIFGKKVTYTTWSSFDNIYPEDISVQVEDFRRHYDDLAHVYSIIDGLRQNVRIWGK